MDMSGQTVTRIDKNGNVVDSTEKLLGNWKKEKLSNIMWTERPKNFLFPNPTITVYV
jgi:hypothetical protein